MSTTARTARAPAWWSKARPHLDEVDPDVFLFDDGFACRLVGWEGEHAIWRDEDRRTADSGQFHWSWNSLTETGDVGEMQWSFDLFDTEREARADAIEQAFLATMLPDEEAQPTVDRRADQPSA